MSPPDEQYPEVVAHGGLAQAVAGTAAARGVAIGDVSTPPHYEPADAWRFADIRCGTQQVSAWLTLAESRFGVSVSRGRHVRADGTTDRLDAVVDVAAAWCAGMPLRAAVQRFPFLAAGDLELAFEAGTQVAYRWGRLLDDAGDNPHLQPLLRAVHADSRLRTLYPSVSHDEQLRLDSEAAGGQLIFELLPSGRYRVQVGTQDPAGVYDVDAAVRWAAELATP